MSEPAARREPEDEESPAGLAQRWQRELSHAKTWLEKWHAEAKQAVDAYLDERESDDLRVKKWNLYPANIDMQKALMYGQVPRVSVERRFADPADDVARVAGETWERALNSDVEKDTDTYADALAQCLEDWMVPGLGVARVRYVMESEITEAKAAIVKDGMEVAPAVEAREQRTYECVETNYVYWQDFRWSPARVWGDVRWVAFRAEMSRAQLRKRFPKHAASIPMKAADAGDGDAKKDGAPKPWARAEVWEIWDRDTEQVYWYAEGYSEILDVQDDPYGLDGFFPCPRPMMANTSTSKAVPRPDYKFARDQYLEINSLSTRISLLVRALRVVGLYNGGEGGQSEAIRKLVEEACENDLIPVQNWNLFAEKGGLKGQVDWFPIEQIVAALVQLMQARQSEVDALYQVTGMADVMRGQQTENGTPGEAQVKARFGSARMQRRQDEFARFATDLQRLKSQVMVNLFADETIIAQSNIEHTPDAELAGEAIALMRSGAARYRIQVKPESVSMQDFAALKAERMEVVAGMAQYVQAIVPMVQFMPDSLPELLEAFQWAVAGMRGASGLEGVLDRGVDKAKKAREQAAANPQQPQQDPKLLAQQMKGQQEMVKLEADKQAKLQLIQAEVQADAQREQTQRMQNVQEAAQKALIGQATRAQHGHGGNGRPT